MDMMDPGDPTYPPMFDCEKCDGLMNQYISADILVLNINTMTINFAYIFYHLILS